MRHAAASAVPLLALLLVLTPGCSRAGERPLERAADLGPGTIDKYRGEKLNDFTKLRDNSIAGPQTVDTAKYRLTVDGLVERPLSLSYASVLAFPRYQKLITLHCVEGWSATGLFQGVLVRDLLDSARPSPRANTLIFHAADGYTTSLPLGLVRRRQLLLAGRINNQSLTARTGFPFQLAAEDKLGYKWIKWVVRIEASADSSYRGFWESRGYDDKADVR